MSPQAKRSGPAVDAGPVRPLAVVSGVAQQDATGAASHVYVTVSGASGGTVSVAIGPDRDTEHTIFSENAARFTHTILVRLPAGWWFTVTAGGRVEILRAVQVA